MEKIRQIASLMMTGQLNNLPKDINTKPINTKLFLALFSLVLVLFSGLPMAAKAATLSVMPVGGTFIVGSTFDVSVIVNTEEETVNTIEASLTFPPDKLQVVSPSSGRSVIGIWAAPPTYDNQKGLLHFLGGIPSPGLNTSSSLVATITFRVKSVGTAILKFQDDSKVLLHDGKGTDALENTTNGIYSLVLPPPAGPIVTSDSHPDQAKWYPSSTIVLRWANNKPVDGYSYILNTTPIDLPDDISEGVKTEVVYKNVSDETNYFHIKALREGQWGGITHFAINVDTTPPADFKIEVLPSRRTTSHSPIITFATTDATSGLDHYEIKIVALAPKTASKTLLSTEQSFFIEALSPYYISGIETGNYDVIVWAYDKSGNFREVIERLKIITPLFKIIEEKGLRIYGAFVVPWLYVFMTGILIILALIYAAFRVWRWHRLIDIQRVQRVLPDEIKNKIEELKNLRDRYGKTLLVLLAVGLSMFVNFGSLEAQSAISPPIVTTTSRYITNQEIPYIGGKTEIPGAEIIIYFQNLQTGETMSHNVLADKKGDWFFTHPKFLQSGNYLLWVQGKIGDELSPPSPQVQITVASTALQLGATRVSFQTLYLASSLILLGLVIGLLIFMAYHFRHGHRKNKLLMKEIREAEEALKRGFAVLRRDVEAELSVIHKAKLGKELLAEEKIREKQLLEDMERISNYIGKEIWDIERAEKPR